MALPRYLLRYRWWGIIILVLPLVVLAVLSAMRQAEESECRYHLQRISLALRAYEPVHDAFPSGTVINPGLPAESRLSWLAELGSESFFAANVVLIVDREQPWDSETNLGLKAKIGRPGEGQTIAPFGDRFVSCPADRNHRDARLPRPTNYVGIAGLSVDAATLPVDDPRAGFFGYDRVTRVQDIKDGLAETMVVAETEKITGSWTAGGIATIHGLDPAAQPYIGRGHQFGGLHRSGVFVLFADGSVRLLADTIDPKIFEAYSTIASDNP